MKRLIKSEILLCFRKKNLLIFMFACILVMFIFQFYFEANYNNFTNEAVNQIQEEIQKAEVNLHTIESRLIGLHQAKVDEVVIDNMTVVLNSWKLEEEYTNYLKVLLLNEQFSTNESEIQNILAKRDQNALNTLKDENMILDYSGLYRNNYRDLLNREKLRHVYQAANVSMLVNQNTPTGAFILSESLNGFNPIMILILICAIIWNADMWSNEFDNNGFQLLFTLPYNKSRIYFTRNIIHILFTFAGITMLLILLFLLGTFKYGHGLDHFLILNQQGISATNIFEVNPDLLMQTDFATTYGHVIMGKIGFFFLYQLCFLSFINLSSLLCKEKGLAIFIPSILMMITYMMVQTSDSVSMFKFIPSCYLLISEILIGEMGISMLNISIILIFVNGLLYIAGRQYLTFVDLKGIR